MVFTDYEMVQPPLVSILQERHGATISAFLPFFVQVHRRSARAKTEATLSLPS